MKRIIAAALLFIPALSFAQDKEAYLDCLLKWGTRAGAGNMELVVRACALKHLENGMEIDYAFEPFKKPSRDHSKDSPDDLCDPVFGDENCANK